MVLSRSGSETLPVLLYRVKVFAAANAVEALLWNVSCRENWFWKRWKEQKVVEYQRHNHLLKPALLNKMRVLSIEHQKTS